MEDQGSRVGGLLDGTHGELLCSRTCTTEILFDWQSIHNLYMILSKKKQSLLLCHFDLEWYILFLSSLPSQPHLIFIHLGPVHWIFFLFLLVERGMGGMVLGRKNFMRDSHKVSQFKMWKTFAVNFLPYSIIHYIHLICLKVDVWCIPKLHFFRSFPY